MGWLSIHHGDAPLVVSVPHAGIEIPAPCANGLVSLWQGRKDADWYVDLLYAFARDLGATIVRTAISRTVIDVNRDPSGKSLYPGQATTELCPTTDFDGDPLYREGQAPDAAEIARRLDTWHRPYHAALETELTRLKRMHGRVVLWDAHSIRSRVPRLFEGELPHLNFGTNSGASCASALIARIEEIAARTDYSRVVNGRFKGGYITRHFGRPSDDVHAVQLEMAMRSYVADEPHVATPQNWPPTLDFKRIPPLIDLITRFLKACIVFAKEGQ